MTDVGGVGQVSVAGLAARPRAGLPAPRFAVSGATPPSSPVSASQPAQGTVALSGLLALQEAGAEAPRDRAARRRGQDILAALAALQRALLGGEGPDDVLARLAVLTADLPRALDPHLDRILAAIALRARVEVARRMPDSVSTRKGGRHKT